MEITMNQDNETTGQTNLKDAEDEYETGFVGSITAHAFDEGIETATYRIKTKLSHPVEMELDPKKICEYFGFQGLTIPKGAVVIVESFEYESHWENYVHDLGEWHMYGQTGEEPTAPDELVFIAM
jgi:hypothetical protein